MAGASALAPPHAEGSHAARRAGVEEARLLEGVDEGGDDEWVQRGDHETDRGEQHA
jgi:hypothetical protein